MYINKVKKLVRLSKKKRTKIVARFEISCYKGPFECIMLMLSIFKTFN